MFRNQTRNLAEATERGAGRSRERERENERERGRREGAAAMAGPATTRAKKMEGISPPATSASPMTKMLNSFGFTPRQMFGQVAAVGAFLHFCLLVCVRAFARSRVWDVQNIHTERARERERAIEHYPPHLDAGFTIP